MSLQSPPDQSTTGKHIPALDGLRGLAILLVLVVHLFVHNPHPSGSLPIRVLALLFASGWVGVDLFFVLSGFLITGILYDTQSSPHFFRNFYARRALRIFPLYYAFLFLLMAVSAAQGYRWFLKGSLLYLTYLHTLWIDGVGYTSAPWVDINHLWSLAIEEQFYLVWPLTVFLLRSRRRIAAMALAVAAASFGLRCWFYASGALQTHPYATYSFTPARLDSLLFGAALAMLVRSRYRGTVLRWAPPVFLAGAAAVLATLFTLGQLYPPGSALVGTVGYPVLALTFSALLASALRPGGAAGRVLASPVLRLLGRYSYGLYVYHFTLSQLLTDRVHAALERLIGPTFPGARILALFGSGLTVTLLSLAVAALSFHFFEQPILRLKRHFPDTGHQPKLRHDLQAATHEAATH